MKSALLGSLAALSALTVAALPARAEPLPEVLASVRLGNGSCSGTIIAIEDRAAYGLTAAHCCRRVGDRQTVHFTDGTKSQATILARDPRVDLALFSLPADAPLGYAPVTKEPTPGKHRAIGFPAGVGPNLKRLKYVDNAVLSSQMGRWRFRVESGTFRGGDSGGGVFSDGPSLIGVITHGGRGLLSARHDQIVAFLAGNQGRCPDCGQGADQWWLQPNVEVPSPGGEKPSQQIAQLTQQLQDLQAQIDQRLTAIEESLADQECPDGTCPLPEVDGVLEGVGDEVTDQVVDAAIDRAAEPAQAGLGTLLMIAVVIGVGVYLYRR